MHEKGFESGLALLPLGNTDARQVIETELSEHLASHTMLALAAIDQNQSGATVSPVATFS
jgi:hypothetical protein